LKREVGGCSVLHMGTRLVCQKCFDSSKAIEINASKLLNALFHAPVDPMPPVRRLQASKPPSLQASKPPSLQASKPPSLHMNQGIASPRIYRDECARASTPHRLRQNGCARASTRRRFRQNRCAGPSPRHRFRQLKCPRAGEDDSSSAEVEDSSSTKADCDDSRAEARRFPHEPYRAGKLPESLGETPRLLWKRASFCEVDGQMHDDQMTHHDYAYGQTKIDGQMRDVIVNANQHFGSTSLSPNLRSIAVIDPEDGEPLNCMTTNLNDATDEGPLKFVSKTGEVFTVATTEQGEAAEEFGIPNIVAQWGRNVDTGEFLFEREFEYETDYPTNGEMALAPFGQFVIATTSDELYALNPDDGSIIWETSGLDYLSDESELNFRRPYATPDKLYLDGYTARGSDQQYMRFSIDSCGNPMRVSALTSDRPFSAVRPIGSYFIGAVMGQVTIYDEDMTHHKTFPCSGIATLSDEEFVCGTWSEGRRAITIYTANVTGELVEHFTFQAPDDAGLVESVMLCNSGRT
jgi:hypothetical protein